MFYPWEYGDKPYFINDEGFEWYVDESTTKYATTDKHLWSGNTRRGMKNVVAFYVRKGEEVKSVLINDDQQIIAEGGSFVELSYRIDLILINEDYSLVGKNVDIDYEREKYYNELSKFSDSKPKRKFHTIHKYHELNG